MEMDDQRHGPAALPLGKRPGTRGRGVWVDPWDDMDYCGNSAPRPYRYSIPGTFQIEASRCTGY